MRTAKIITLAVGAIALTFLATAPRAHAITITAPAGIETVAPGKALVQKVRYVCRRYRVRRYGRWHWRTRCYWTRPHYRPYRPYRHHRYYRHGRWYWR